jgi:hypothetical protein
MAFDPRDLRREYVKTPQLVQTGSHLPATPQSPEQWDQARRLFDSLKEAIEQTDGLTTEVTISGTTLTFRSGILIGVE